MINIIAVFIGGGIGSLCRWSICSKLNSHWGVLLANIIGAFLIGCAYEYFSRKTTLPPEAKLFIMTGLLGGFTTFSTYLLDFVTLLNTGHVTEGISYLLLSVFLGVAFLLLGSKLTAVLCA